MYNWNTDTTELKKDKKKYTIWKLEQMVNFGLGKEKISKILLQRYWNELNLDPKRKKFLELILNG
jgi:hypothetical protein